MMTLTFKQIKAWMMRNGYWNRFTAELDGATSATPEELYDAIASGSGEDKNIEFLSFFNYTDSIYGAKYWSMMLDDFKRWRDRFKADGKAALLLAYMQEGNSITQEDAERLFGIARLTARICDLRRRGHVIIQDSHRDSEGKRYSSYRIEVKK